MYMCVKGIDSVPSQTFGRSSICVLKVSIMYQARRLDGDVYVCKGYRFCTKPDIWTVMYMCVKGADSVPGQTFRLSCICVLRVSILFQSRRLDSHVYVC